AQTTICGNGIADFDENGIPGPPFGPVDCDDGNNDNADDCLNTCLPATCGDGVTRTGGTPPFEQCDDGNNRNNDACVVGCQHACCADAFIVRRLDGFATSTKPTFSATCHAHSAQQCGHGTPDPGEACDDGNNSNKDDCLNTCVSATCGDGFVRTKGTPPFE